MTDLQFFIRTFVHILNTKKVKIFKINKYGTSLGNVIKCSLILFCCKMNKY